MLRIEYAYWLIGAFLIYCAWRNLRERKGWHAAFWFLLGVLFAAGDFILEQQAAGNALPAQCAGVAVIVLALLAPRLRRHPHAVDHRNAERTASAVQLGHRLLLPAVLIPLITLLVALLGGYLTIAGLPVFAPRQMTLTGLALACVVALAAAAWITRTRVDHGVAEGRRLLDAIGWAALLPLLLAALGQVFTRSGVGADVAALAGDVLPTGSALACLIAFSIGMVLFTVIMGNAFAAFPVMMAGLGLPLLISEHHANPAMLGATGMLCGYCGTLVTPMAADFNLVPAALLELRNPYGVIRAQAWSAVWIFLGTVLLMWLLLFR